MNVIQPPSGRLQDGRAHPLGATVTPHGVNFSIYSEHASSVVLCLFEGTKGEVERKVELRARTGHIWHGFVEGAAGGQEYGYRVDGPWAPTEGHLFNPCKLLIDPYAHMLTGAVMWDESLFGYRREPNADLSLQSMGDSSRSVPRSVVIDPNFDWESVESPVIGLADTIIYETHVKGMTAQHPDVPEHLRGTYAGFAHESVIEHLKSLNVTSVEFLPFQAFVDEEFLVNDGLRNYWGYNSIGFFATEPRYASAATPQERVDEVKSMIRELHRHGFEVILDVVYNHTAEGNGSGPTLSFRGIDNRTYYRLTPGNPAEYVNYSGTGNTLNIDHPVALTMVLDSLRYWVTHFHIDGFRFDLAPALGRDGESFSNRSAFFKALHQDPVLSTVKLIAEPWDVGPGGYQVGHFPHGWSEWNDKFRDSIRSFWLGHPQTTGEFALRMTGSMDLYAANRRGPMASVNYVTCHDGFTLIDLVSFDQKHNQANQEQNEDGHNHNLSRNFGVEGATTDPLVNERRDRARRNMLASMLLAHGVPMLLGGDELSRTQQGNNNAYAQDNPITWFDWSENSRDEHFLSFVKLVTEIRTRFPQLKRSEFRRSELPAAVTGAEPAWKEAGGQDVQPHDWGRQSPRTLQLHLAANGSGAGELYILFNADALPVEFVLPVSTSPWELVLDTRQPDGAPLNTQSVRSTFLMDGESLVLFASGESKETASP